MSNKTITARTIQKFTLHQAAERPDLAVLEIQVMGETMHFSVPVANLRALGEGILKQAEKFEAANRPN